MEENSDEMELIKQVSMLESIAKRKMSKEAISRYGNIKIAHPETAIKAIAAIAQAVQLGQVKEILSDDDFKSILFEIQNNKKEFRLKK